MIIYSRGKFIEAKDEIDLRPKIRGFFTMQARKGSIIVRERFFENVIVDNGLDRFGNVGSENLYGYCQVGTGTTTPSTTDTTLASYLTATTSATNTDSKTNSGSPDYYTDTRIQYTFALGAVVGNLTEIGAAGQSASGNLFSRALILDDMGSPTTFPVLSDEQLIVYYTVRTYPPMSDVTGTVTVGDTLRDYTVRPIDITNSGAWGLTVGSGSLSEVNVTVVTGAPNNMNLRTGSLVPATTGNPTGSGSNSSNISNSGYTSLTYYRDATGTWNPGSWNGTRNVLRVVRRWSAWQILYDPPIAKTSDQQLTLPTRLSWDRYTP